MERTIVLLNEKPKDAIAKERFFNFKERMQESFRLPIEYVEGSLEMIKNNSWIFTSNNESYEAVAKKANDIPVLMQKNVILFFVEDMSVIERLDEFNFAAAVHMHLSTSFTLTGKVPYNRAIPWFYGLRSVAANMDNIMTRDILHDKNASTRYCGISSSNLEDPLELLLDYLSIYASK